MGSMVLRLADNIIIFKKHEGKSGMDKILQIAYR
jgi:hypothetical protein